VTSKYKFGRDFGTLLLPTKIRLIFHGREVIMLTNRCRDAAENIHIALLCYDISVNSDVLNSFSDTKAVKPYTLCLKKTS